MSNVNLVNDSELRVYILTKNVNDLNEDYVRIFSQSDSGLAQPIFLGIQYPDKNWYAQFNKLNSNQAIELYNHYQIWLESINSGQPIVILYDHSAPNQSDEVVRKLIKAGQLIHDRDILFYGKYLDSCDQYTHERTVILNDSYPIYQTLSPHGTFAYMIYPSGAQKLLDNMQNLSVDALINKLVEDRILSASTYHPSIIRININNPTSKYECRESNSSSQALTWGRIFWYILIFVLVGLLIGVLIYFLTVNKQSQSTLEYDLDSPQVRVNSIQSPLSSVV